MRKERGFTLIELMVTLAVAAILLGVGIPSMLEFMKTNRRAATVNALVTDLQRARSTAASTGRNVVLCHSTDGASCSGAPTPDWTDGWILFVDADGDAAFDAGETLVNVNAGREGVTMPSNQDAFLFSPGFRSMGVAGTGTVAVCLEGDTHDRWIVVGTNGRPRLKTTQTDVACPS